MTGKNEWIVKRARCTPAYCFDMLVNAINRDVRLFNELERVQQDSAFFMVEGRSATRIEVHRAHCVRCRPNKQEMERASEADEDFVQIYLYGASIFAERRDFWCYEIRTEWNPESLTCDLIFNKTARGIDYLSQAIIGDFMFEGVED